MIIRPVTRDEWKSVQALNAEVFIDNQTYDPDLILDWSYSPEGAAYFQELVVDPNQICLVAENESGELVGYIACAPKFFDYRKSKYLEINNMGVSPAYRSQGVGKKLFEAARDAAQKSGYDKLFVNSYAKNTRAIQFYQSCGFEVIDVSLESNVEISKDTQN